jgi:hypothetical protein
MKFVVKKAVLGYYGYQDSGKEIKSFIPAWCFNLDNGEISKTVCVNAVSGEVFDLDSDLQEAKKTLE